MSGVFAVARSIFDHPLFAADEPFTEREAWIWLISEAAWMATRVRVGHALVSLDRGEVSHSIRFLADKWRWHRARVERFLKRLKTETMIGTRIEDGVTVIRLCKYNEYQRVSLPGKTQSETQTETVARQSRDREEDRENIEDKKVTISSASADSPPVEKKSKVKKPEEYTPAFLDLWRAYRAIGSESPGSKKDAAVRFERLSPEDQADCRRGMDLYAGKQIAKGERKYVCQLVVFINGRRWEPELEDASPAVATGPPRPPEDWMPSDEELRRKYRNGPQGRNPEPSPAEREGGSLLPAGGGVRRASEALWQNQPDGDPKGQRRVPGVGGVLPGERVGADGFRDGEAEGPAVGHHADAVAPMVRH